MLIYDLTLLYLVGTTPNDFIFNRALAGGLYRVSACTHVSLKTAGGRARGRGQSLYRRPLALRTCADGLAECAGLKLLPVRCEYAWGRSWGSFTVRDGVLGIGSRWSLASIPYVS